MLEAMQSAGVTPHLVTADDADPARAAALRERGWGVDVLPEPPQSTAHRVRQQAERRPSPYLHGVAGCLRELRSSLPAFVQLEHPMSAYYWRVHPADRVLLSLHNVDSEMLATVARGERRLTPGWAVAWNRATSTSSVERRAVRRAEVSVCVSEHDRDVVEGLGGRTLLVPNGVDAELFDIPDALPREDRVLFFGRWDYAPNANGLRRFLDEGGWARLAAARPEARLRIVGGGLPDALRTRVQREPQAEAVGFVPDLNAELACAALVLVPVWQGGGTRLKVLEGLAAGRPIVGTALGVGGVGFEDGVHGLVAEEPRELAAAAASLLADRPRAVALAAAGRSLAERFRWNRVLAPLVELYADWAAPRSRPAIGVGARH